MPVAAGQVAQRVGWHIAHLFCPPSPARHALAEALVLCARCTQSIWPGEPRWACERGDGAAADQPRAVCFRDGCLDSEAARTHSCTSPVTPVIGLVENDARGASCGALVLHTFRRFAGAPAVVDSWRRRACLFPRASAQAAWSSSMATPRPRPSSCVVAGAALVPLSAPLGRAALLDVLAKTAPSLTPAWSQRRQRRPRRLVCRLGSAGRHWGGRRRS